MTKTTPKDFFVQLGATIALYASTIALLNLVFETINRALPDAVSGYYSAGSIVWPISMLIVLVPTLYILEWMVAHDIKALPEKAEIWIRRWRIYLTLFLTGATIVGDLIVLINTYLTGEISGRFIYKVLTVFVISAIVFAYYLLERINSASYGAKMWHKILGWLGIVVVLAGLIAGFIIVGSPAKQRALRFDEQRVNDLTAIQYNVAHYWQEFGKVPATLFTVPEYGAVVPPFTPKDPSTGVPYTYEPGSQSNSFKLCAIFSASSTDSGVSYPVTKPVYGSNFYDWTHGAGEVCFNRTVSAVDFPPLNVPTTVPAKN